MAGLLDDVKAKVGQMDPESVKAELAKLLAANVKHQAKQKEYNSKPEVQAKRKEYSTAYRERIMSDPEKAEAVKASRKAYMSKPEVKERQKAYRQQRAAELKLLRERAAELGIDVEALAQQAMAAANGGTQPNA